MTSSSPLALRQTVLSDQAERFVQSRQDMGLSPASTALLARILSVCDRQSIKVGDSGRRALSEMGEQGLSAIAHEAWAATTDQDVTRVAGSALQIWSRPVCPGQPEKDATTMMGMIHDPHVVALMKSWSEPQPVITWDQARSIVQSTLIRQEIDLPERPAPNTLRGARLELKLALQEAGVHTMSWSRWLYPDGQEHLITHQVRAANQALQSSIQTPGPLLGVGGAVRLHLDDATRPSDDAQTPSPKIALRALGSTTAGSTEISLCPKSSWAGLGRQWFCAVDELTRIGYAANPDQTPSQLPTRPLGDLYDQAQSVWGDLPKDPTVQADPAAMDAQAAAAWFQDWVASPPVQDLLGKIQAPKPVTSHSVRERRPPVGLPKPAQLDPSVFKGVTKAPRSPR